MTLANVAEGVLTVAGWLGRELLYDVAGEVLGALVKAPFRREESQPPLAGLERGAETARLPLQSTRPELREAEPP